MTAQTIVPRLRVGAGKPDGSTGLCGMQVISWESGDTTITDLPACADPMLAKIVQRVNDSICVHRDGDLLCPSCSIRVLALAHRTVGTGLAPQADEDQRLDRRRVWVRVAADQARQVLHLATTPEALRAIEAAEAWADNPCEETRQAAHAAADAAHAAAYAALAAAAHAAYVAAAHAAAAAAAAHAAYAAAAHAAAHAHRAHAAHAAAYAAHAADDAAHAAANAAVDAAYAHRAIDTFHALTTHPTPTAAGVR